MIFDPKKGGGRFLTPHHPPGVTLPAGIRMANGRHPPRSKLSLGDETGIRCPPGAERGNPNAADPQPQQGRHRGSAHTSAAPRDKSSTRNRTQSPAWCARYTNPSPARPHPATRAGSSELWQETRCSCCNAAVAADGQLLQHPHSPWIGNRAGPGCSELQHTSCCRKRAATAAAPRWQPTGSRCSTPIAPELVTGRGLAAVSCSTKAAAGSRLQLLQHGNCSQHAVAAAPP